MSQLDDIENKRKVNSYSGADTTTTLVVVLIALHNPGGSRV